MLQPAVPLYERKRLRSLKKTYLLNTPAESKFDSITKLASYICKTPIALITLVDDTKQWFKSKIGTEICDTDRNISFCGHAILEPKDLMEVQDTRLDPRFKNNPLTRSQKDPILFYAGVPLLDSDGMPLGTLCVLDTKVNKLDKGQKEALKDLGKQVESLFELHRKNHHLEKAEKELHIHNTLLKNFAAMVSHDIKMPLANMVITTDVLRKKYAALLGKEGVDYLKNLKRSSLNLSNYVNGILSHYESDTISASLKQKFNLNHLLEEIIDLLNITEDCEINLPEQDEIIKTNRAVIEQIFLNLLGNSLKYNNKDKIIIDIGFRKTRDYYYFSIKDNGMGIPLEKHRDIFKLFTTLHTADRQGNKGNGIGLSTVKKLVKRLKGKIRLNSEIDKGTEFLFSIKRNLSE
ncbi:sensor histidine kinase [Salegentibacter chungangensis]|uniref:histidine kinase n=1 Tax=Salegentibacter chungangensis TaxID=1335724 RepID=A0ABW3NTH3_9FLAO